MANTSQRRALKNYRDRLAARGMARFEVLGREADRVLIRSLARRLAEDHGDAPRIREAVSRAIAASRRGGEASSPRCAARPWSAPM